MNDSEKYDILDYIPPIVTRAMNDLNLPKGHLHFAEEGYSIPMSWFFGILMQM